MGEISPVVASISTGIARRAAGYTAELDRPDRRERELIDFLDDQVEAVLTQLEEAVAQRPPSRQRHGGLIFRHLYAAARSPVPDEEGWQVPSALPAALIAAEVEFRGPLRLSARRQALLAEVYERLGAHLLGIGLPVHAALAYRRAEGLYRMNEDIGGEDRCGLQLARANTRALPPGWRRWAGQLSDVLCGHGYRPFWLLGWVAVQLVVFTLLGVLVADPRSVAETVYMCVTSFLNPLGPGDTEGLGAAARPIFAVESWAGTVSMSVFFALLVRKWFRA
ncbi:hypothetical protein [Nocardia spumae]|uniref:hypothetical protein n=1 Tax=Nocardia spumae TaxID=2887190 RepID=UPI001D15B389|nr:hypothetical protein [Nocardia spumae]